VLQMSHMCEQRGMADGGLGHDVRRAAR
jgi:hypothetical protein